MLEYYPEEKKELTVQDLLNESNSNSISISYDELASLNIILNNNECRSLFFDKVCEVLQQDGFPFQVVQGSLSGDVKNSTIITLDMLYSAGRDTLIFAPVDNTRVGYSDSLALSMQAGFLENGIQNQKIVCGQVGFRKDSEGNVQHCLPTPTEEAIGTDYNTNFVTISFGTDKVDPIQVAKGIESGLLRQKYYLEHDDIGSDLIYKSNTGEDITVVADYFGSSVRDLCMMNGIKGLDALEERVIINPSIRQMKVFDSHTSFQMENNYSKTY